MDPSSKPVLVIAPHPDDEILGVGGTIAKYTERGWPVTVLTVSGHTPPLYPSGVYEQTVEEALKAHALVGVSDSRFMFSSSSMSQSLASKIGQRAEAQSSMAMK